MRLFFAVWPPPDTAHALWRWARAARRDCRGRVTREDRIHLTLAFLGEVDPDAARATARSAGAPASALRIEQARYWGRNRIVWAGPAQTPPALAALARALGETRGFDAHVTLLRDARPPHSLPRLPALEWPVAEFLLVSSTLGPRGPDYEVLERFALD